MVVIFFLASGRGGGTGGRHTNPVNRGIVDCRVDDSDRDRVRGCT